MPFLESVFLRKKKAMTRIKKNAKKFRNVTVIYMERKENC